MTVDQKLLDWLDVNDSLIHGSGLSLEDAGEVSDLGRHSTSLDTQIAIQQALGKLTPKERIVFTRRHVLGQSQTEIAQSMSVSQARISQLETAAISKLQSLLA